MMTAASTAPNFTSLASRPGHGSTGRKIKLRANFFPVTFDERSMVYHYEVTITPEQRYPDVIRQLFLTAEEMYPDVFDKCNPVFDGKKNAYATLPMTKGEKEPLRLVLPICDEGEKWSKYQKYLDEYEAKGGVDQELEMMMGLDGTKKPKRSRIVKMVLTPVAEVSLANLSQYIGGRMEDLPREAMQCLDIAMAYQLCRNYTQVGKSYYDSSIQGNVKTIQGAVQIWLGHFQSLRATKAGLMLNVDVAATTMYEETDILSFLLKRFNLRHPNDLGRSMARKMVKELKGLKIEVTHRGEQRRKYRVYGISDVSANADTFELEDGTETNVADYFTKRYEFKLNFPHMPCLLVGSKARHIALPLEACKLARAQSYLKTLDGKQRSDMLTATCQNPRDRMAAVERSIPDINNDPRAKAFGLTLSKKMIEVEGRIINPPTLGFGGGSTMQPRDGKWGLRDLKFSAPGQIATCAVAAFGRVPTDVADGFMRDMVRTCGQLGIRFKDVPKAGKIQPGEPLEQALKGLPCSGRPQIIFCFLESDKDFAYPEIKRVCETILGVPTQCFDSNKMRDKKKSGTMYQQNVAMKINAKLGGTNNIVAGGLLPQVYNTPTMIMGADVHHPGAGSFSPSIGGVVASFNRDFTQYNTYVREQENRKEIILDMKLIAKNALRDFYLKSKMKPAQIIMFRDGVGEGMFKAIFDSECKDILDACEEIEPGYRPKVTFIIVQKRHHTRLFAGRNDADRGGNLLPGTVCDDGIVDPKEFDFFLCSHAGLKGTSKPTHYHVLYDEIGFSADDIQQLTYKLCHVYARCARVTSIPAPAYYAHLAAYRARFYGRYDQSSDDSASEISGFAGATPMSPEQMNKVALAPGMQGSLFYA